MPYSYDIPKPHANTERTHKPCLNVTYIWLLTFDETKWIIPDSRSSNTHEIGNASDGNISYSSLTVLLANSVSVPLKEMKRINSKGIPQTLYEEKCLVF